MVLEENPRLLTGDRPPNLSIFQGACEKYRLYSCFDDLVIHSLILLLIHSFFYALVKSFIHSSDLLNKTLQAVGIRNWYLKDISSVGYDASIESNLAPNLSIFQFKTQYSTRLVTRTVVRTENGSEQSASMPPPSSVENGTSLLENVTRALGTLQEVLTFEEIVPVPGSANGINALGLVVFSVAFGLVIGGMKHKGRVLRDFFDSLNEAIMRLVGIIIW